MAQRRWRRRSFPPEVLMEITRLSGLRLSGAEITRQLERDERFTDRCPSERTVQEIVRDLTLPDDSGIWSVAGAKPDDARLILPVLALVFDESKGKVYYFSKGLARWIAKLRRAAPEIPLPEAYFLARLYRACQGQDETERDYRELDLYLARSGWEMPPVSTLVEMVHDIARRVRAPMPGMEARS